MKIIKVSGCHDCPHAEHWEINKKFDFICMKLVADGVEDLMEVYPYIESKTLPGNCPLEDVPKTGFGSSFDFLADKGEDVYTGTEGELITFKNKSAI